MKRSRRPPPPAHIKRHWNAVASVGCVVFQRPNPSIHHVHSGSIVERLIELGLESQRGMSQRGYSDWLVIPLAPELHYIGRDAIDGSIGVKTWEAKYGKQSDFVDYVGEMIGYSLWERHAEAEREKQHV